MDSLYRTEWNRFVEALALAAPDEEAKVALLREFGQAGIEVYRAGLEEVAILRATVLLLEQEAEAHVQAVELQIKDDEMMRSLLYRADVWMREDGSSGAYPKSILCGSIKAYLPKEDPNGPE